MRLSRTLSSRTTSLFAAPTRLGQGSSFLVSIMVHGALLILLSWGILSAPQVSGPVPAHRYNVRKIALHQREPQPGPAFGSGIRYPGPQSSAQPLQSDEKKQAAPRATVRLAQAARGLQTLMQPDFPADPALPEEIPVPAIMIWTPKKSPVKTIVPPLPEKPTAADVKPSLDASSEALNLADHRVPVSDSGAPMPMPAPSSTSPVTLQGPEPVQLPPASTSDSASQPTPAAVLSLSDLRMREGTVTLPPVNETLPSASLSMPDVVLPSLVRTPKLDASSEQSASDKAKGSATANRPSTSRVTLPKDGQYAVVVVGASLEDEYPEIFQLWEGRMVYTVYLPVGQTRNWSLQYSLPRSASSAALGDDATLQAPWPYDIVRPRLASGDFITDALVLHGFVNKAGHFESLSIVYPAQFQYAGFVLNVLQRWLFRPASLSGQATTVEIVLVIPREDEIGQ